NVSESESRGDPGSQGRPPRPRYRRRVPRNNTRGPPRISQSEGEGKSKSEPSDAPAPSQHFLTLSALILSIAVLFRAYRKTPAALYLLDSFYSHALPRSCLQDVLRCPLVDIGEAVMCRPGLKLVENLHTLDQFDN
ncbi:unnamed protein product, partial [Timema podura]|nr:unnamed protein product [Timema podura]